MIAGFLILGVPIMAVVSLILYAPFYLINRKKYGKRPFLRHLSVFIFIGVIVSLFYATIFVGGIDFHPGYHLINLHPFIWMRETYAMGAGKMAEQLALNLGMMIPMGFILPVVFGRMRKFSKTVGCVIILIAAIETIQYFIGRSADVDDLIMNTLGSMIGYGIFALCNCLFGKKSWWKKAMNIEC